MPPAPALSTASLLAAVAQSAGATDTLVARLLPQRDLFDWTSGILQLVVLLLGIGMLATLIVLLLSMRAAVQKATAAIERVSEQTKPLIEQGTLVVSDAREVVAMVRTDVERLTDAAGAVSQELALAAESAGRRLDEVNAVLDVLQREMEGTAIRAVASVRGMAEGASHLGEVIRPRRSRPRVVDGAERGAESGADPDLLAEAEYGEDEHRTDGATTA